MGETITAGGLEFFFENRVSGQDGGPSLQVRGVVDGQPVQMLRFDMFYGDPHYHYAPTGYNLQYKLDPMLLEQDDGIGWALSLVRAKLPRLLTKAGFEAILPSLDQPAIASALSEVERRWRAQPRAETPAAMASQ
jgi:hypothetical protein